MRLKALEVQGFRGFAGGATFDLDADAVLVVGANGSGKTTIFDAAMWAIVGQLPRVEEPGGSVVSEFSNSGEARVSLQLDHGDFGPITIVRSTSLDAKDDERLQVDMDGAALRGPQAQVALLERIWPEALSAPEGGRALLTAFTRSVYLQQDLVRQFLEADTDMQRFEAVSELVGVGRVRELQVELDKSRRAWSKATNTLAGELDQMKNRLSSLDAELARLSEEAAPPSEILRLWEEWWKQLSEELRERRPVPAFDSGEASAQLDDALNRLSAESRATGRRVVEARAILQEVVDEEEAPGLEVADLEAEIKKARSRAKAAQSALDAARRQEIERREAALRTKEGASQLSALAQLALAHLGDRCPVCTQTYDRDHTIAHLQAVIDAGRSSADEGAGTPVDVEDLSKAAADAQLSLQRMEARQQSERAAREARDLAADQRIQRLASLGITATLENVLGELRELVRSLEEREAALGMLRSRGEDLALQLARTGELARRTELLRQRETLAADVARRDLDLDRRRETGAVGEQLLDALRDAASTLVGAQLGTIEPLAQRIYARVDPHPAFRDVALTSTFRGGRGRVEAEISDTLSGAKSPMPGTVLSSSQLNALAVAIFLALNLGVPALPVEAVLLDDPLQSLDDVNLLGLVDLLRRAKERHQLIISTHDPRFAALLERKLRPVGKSRTVVIELSGWQRHGPQVRQRWVPPDEHPLRLVA
jgi:DNA repair exonuclease SbcCD ATPase subunit